ncbi:MFS transporter [Saccharicrinis sp. FJH62]|uniref:MFS transporter n=1 Tax=Saccharicrinis sp. FJH62 TaxID=3344657 RepID=UPI0035D52B19
MSKRTPFPKVFWTANSIEVLERFAYYGLYMPFGIYLESIGLTKGDLGLSQSILLGFSYLLPLFSGTFADKFGFKKMLMFSYIFYIPAFLLFMITDTAGGIAMTMLILGFGAGIFKPLISATVRATTDSTNKTLGFGIFYQMVNLGASLGPIVVGKLRGWDWNYVFIAAAVTMLIAAIITLVFYKEPPREIEGITLKQKFRDMGEALSDVKFLIFLILLGLFFWLPFWAFFNTVTVYIHDYLDTAQLYHSVRSIFGEWFTKIISHNDDGIWKINAEAISHTGYIIILLQLVISRTFEKRAAIPSFLLGLFISAIGFIVLGLSYTGNNNLVFLGIFIFAIGEMISSPRIQEYIMWIAPKEKAGLYMGTNFLATFIGASLSGIYTSYMDNFEEAGNPHFIMYTLAVHAIIGIIAIWIFTKTLGEFKERTE